MSDVGAETEAIMKGDMSIRVGAEGDKTFHNIMYAAISVAPEAVIGVLNKVFRHITCIWLYKLLCHWQSWFQKDKV